MGRKGVGNGQRARLRHLCFLKFTTRATIDARSTTCHLHVTKHCLPVSYHVALSFLHSAQFSAFVARGIINDLEGWYSPTQKKFSAIVALGREVAGFPRIVHGGLTAAIFDEAFGGLLFSLKKAGGVNFWGPAYTVQLDVSYKAKIPAGATVLCSAKIDSMEGRKMWMKATMSDGPDGKVYATARALFVAPKPSRLIVDVVKYIASRAAEALPGRGNGGSEKALQPSKDVA